MHEVKEETPWAPGLCRGQVSCRTSGWLRKVSGLSFVWMWMWTRVLMAVALQQISVSPTLRYVIPVKSPRPAVGRENMIFPGGRWRTTACFWGDTKKLP